MSVLLLTIFVGLVLVGFFVFLFLHQSSGDRRPSQRDALLPLEEEMSRADRSRRVISKNS